jgi:hypothetical protein
LSNIWDLDNVLLVIERLLYHFSCNNFANKEPIAPAPIIRNGVILGRDNVSMMVTVAQGTDTLPLHKKV